MQDDIESHGNLFARSLAFAQIAWGAGALGWIIWYTTAGIVTPFQGPLPFLGAHFGFVLGLMLLLLLLAGALLGQHTASRSLFWAIAVYGTPLLLWQLLATSLILLAPPSEGSNATLVVALSWSAPVAFISAGLGVLAAFQARASLRRAIVMAAIPGGFCLFLATAMLAAYVATHHDMWQQPEASELASGF
jgi:hypothetical protein